jgi:phage-related protein
MDSNDVFSIRPGDVSDVTGQLTELTDRVRRVMDTEALNLTVQASAGDEVSQRVASTLNEVHTSFTKASDQGRTQIRDVATTLRTHTDNVVAADQGLSG